MTPRNILVMQLARFGDLVQTWPFIRQLKRTYPEARLNLLSDQELLALGNFGPQPVEYRGMDLRGMSLLTSENVVQAYHACSHVIGDLRDPGFDLVFTLNYSRLSLLLASLLKAPVKGYRPLGGGREFWREPWLAFVYGLVHARPLNRLHLSDVFRHLAPAAAPSPPLPFRPDLSDEPVVALQLSTRHPMRTWPLPYFTRLATRLVDELAAKLWLIGTASERSLGERLRNSLPPAYRERLTNLQGQTGLTELAERLREAHLLVSGDTGTLHLASALGTQVLAIFLGPAHCFETGPYGEGHLAVQAEPPCHPCTEAGHPCPEPFCQTMITPDFVGDLACSILGGRQLAGGVSLPQPGLEFIGASWSPLASTMIYGRACSLR